MTTTPSRADDQASSLARARAREKPPRVVVLERTARGTPAEIVLPRPARPPVGPTTPRDAPGAGSPEPEPRRAVATSGRAQGASRARRPGTRPEDRLQRAVLEWLAVVHPELREATIHVPNQGTASRTRGAILAGLGVEPGVPDLLCFAPRGPWVGLALELKVRPSKPTRRQWAWIHRLAAAGWYAGWADDLETAQEAVRRYDASGLPGCPEAPLARPGPPGDGNPDPAAASAQGAGGAPGRPRERQSLSRGRGAG